MARHFLANVGALSASRTLVMASQILVLPILARHLEIADFGDVALAMTVVVFAQLLSDAGLSRSLIRRDVYDPAEWSSVFWLLLAVGLGLSALMVAIAPVWSWMFSRPPLTALVTALCVIPLIFAISAVPTARMERDSRFPTLALVRATAAATGFGTAVALAMAGAGPWALVGQQIALAAVQGGAAVALSGFRPLSPRRRVPLGGHFVFARNTLGVAALYTAERQAPIMMVGYWLGAAPLGLYSMSQRILNLPQFGLAAPASRVAFVRMSVVREDPVRLGETYAASLRLLALGIFPPMAVLAGVGETAFPLLLSEAWRPVATIFALAAPGIALEAATSTTGVLLQAVNRTELRLRMAFERTLLRVGLIALALPFGVAGVATAITLSAFCYLPRKWTLLNRAIALDWRASFAALAGPAAASLVLWTACRWLQAETDGWATLGWAALVLAAVWIPTALTMLRRAVSALSA